MAKLVLVALVTLAAAVYLVGSAVLLQRFARREQYGRLVLTIFMTIAIFIALRAWSGGPFLPDDVVYLR